MPRKNLFIATRDSSHHALKDRVGTYSRHVPEDVWRNTDALESFLREAAISASQSMAAGLELRLLGKEAQEDGFLIFNPIGWAVAETITNWWLSQGLHVESIHQHPPVVSLLLFTQEELRKLGYMVNINTGRSDLPEVWRLQDLPL